MIVRTVVATEPEQAIAAISPKWERNKDVGRHALSVSKTFHSSLIYRKLKAAELFKGQ